MVDDVEARLAFEVIDAADVEQHGKALAFERDQTGAQLGGFDAFDDRIVDRGSDGGRIERSRADRRRLRTRHVSTTLLRAGQKAAAPTLTDLLLNQIDGVQEPIGRRRTPGHIDIDRDDGVDTLYDRVVVEDAAGTRARPHRDDPFRI